MDAASPVSQTIKGADARAGTDTDTAGGLMVYAAGRGTGTGAGGNLDLQVAYPGTTGTGHNALGTVIRLLGANKQSSGTASANSLIALTPIVNQSGTAGYTGLKLDVTETATGSGTKNLLELQIGTTSKFTVDNTGAITVGGVSTQSVTCADDAAGTNAALTVTMTAPTQTVLITQADAHGCDITVSETNAVTGWDVTFVVIAVTAGAVNFADSSGVTELAGAFAADINDTLHLQYGTAAWHEVSRSAN